MACGISFPAPSSRRPLRRRSSTISVIEDRREGPPGRRRLSGLLRSPSRPGRSRQRHAPRPRRAGEAWLLLLAPVLGYTPSAQALVPGALVLAFVALALTGLGLAIAWMLESTQGFHAIKGISS
ncbi:MAG: hypothetical protein IPN03_24080 [Holophagales bacterium]|nr:hypothetical protein [Holophagales bacterium]